MLAAADTDSDSSVHQPGLLKQAAVHDVQQAGCAGSNLRYGMKNLRALVRSELACEKLIVSDTLALW